MKIGLKTLLLGASFAFTALSVPFCEKGHAAVALSTEQPVATFNLSIPSATPHESASKKLTDNITVRLNQDLFEKGLEVETGGYGQYFASLEASNHFDLKFKSNPAQTALKRKMRQSSVSGAMRLGGFVTKKSKLYLKVGFESENFAGANTLKTPGVNSSNHGYWRTVMASGVGFEYGVSKKWSVLGEASTMALPLPVNGLLEQAQDKDKDDKKTSKASKFNGRDNRVLLGFRYRFGGK